MWCASPSTVRPRQNRWWQALPQKKGILVSVLSADTRDLSGQCYGSMLLKLPTDVEQAKQAAAYMRAQPGITVEEVTGE